MANRFIIQTLHGPQICQITAIRDLIEPLKDYITDIEAVIQYEDSPNSFRTVSLDILMQYSPETLQRCVDKEIGLITAAREGIGRYRYRSPAHIFISILGVKGVSVYPPRRVDFSGNLEYIGDREEEDRLFGYEW